MTTCKPLNVAKGTGTLVRPQYAPGLLLEDEDLTSAVDYTRNSMRLMFRSLFGCGVICGLKVSAEFPCGIHRVRVTVASGVALDCSGNPIEVRDATPVEYDWGCATVAGTLWVAVCYVDRCCMPTDVGCSDDESSTKVFRRSLDGYEIRIFECMPECVCSCEKLKERVTTQDPSACCDEHATGTPTTPSPAAVSVPGTPVSTNTVGSGTADSRADDPCNCYKAHNCSECACDCGCSCVVVGKINVVDVAKGTYNVDYSPVRHIRPMLIGAKDCYCPPARGSQEMKSPGQSTQHSFDARGLVDDRIAAVLGSIASRGRRAASLEVSLAQVETDLVTARMLVSKTRRAAEEAEAAGTANAVELKRVAWEAEVAAGNLEAQQKMVARQLEEERVAVAADQSTLARASTERELGLLQAKLSYIDQQVLAASLKGIEAVDLRELTERRSVTADQLLQKTNELVRP